MYLSCLRQKRGDLLCFFGNEPFESGGGVRLSQQRRELQDHSQSAALYGIGWSGEQPKEEHHLRAYHHYGQ
jgi:hypothetical protein